MSYMGKQLVVLSDVLSVFAVPSVIDELSCAGVFSHLSTLLRCIITASGPNHVTLRGSSSHMITPESVPVGSAADAEH